MCYPQAINIITDLSYSRTKDPDKALCNNSGPDVSMAPDGSTSHSDQYGPGGCMTLGHPNGHRHQNGTNRCYAPEPHSRPLVGHSPLIDLLTAEPPPYRAALAVPATGPETGMTAIGGAAAPEKMATGGDTGGTPAPSPIAGRLRARRDDTPLESKAFPLREGPGRHLQKVQLASGQVTHSFLHIPDCPHPLLGRDLLTKLKAQIYFDERGPTVTGPGGTPLQVLALNLEEEYRLFEPEPPEEPPGEMQDWLDRFPQVWAETGGLGLAHDQPPLVISLKASAAPISIRQYPMSREAQEGIKPHIRRLIDQGVLKPCRSPWNTPLLPVKKPGTGEFRPVQDLREVNKRVEDIHPTVPNPYNLLSTLPPTHTWDPEIGLSGQLTWTRLPQGFKNSPTLFDEALHADLAGFRVEHPTLTLLQYVDDLLLAARSRTECLEGTQALLTRLGEKGYRASVKKAQICQNKVIYLGYTLEGGRRWLTEARKEAIVSIPPPKGPRQVREFLGTALLLDTDRVTFGPTVSLNPATLLPLPASSGEHDCLQILAEAHGTRPDLTDQPLKDSDYVWFTDGSSFLEEGTRRAGAAVTTESEVVWASPLPAGTSAQRAELIALTQALRMAEGSPHQVKRLIWQVISQTGETIWSTTANHAPHTWWPPLTPDICQLVAGLDAWDIAHLSHSDFPVRTARSIRPGGGRGHLPQRGPGCINADTRCSLSTYDFYVCPRDGRNRNEARRCGGYEEFFCKQWGCETTGGAYWKPSSSWDLITVSKNYSSPNKCTVSTEGTVPLPIVISFTEKGKEDRGWQSGHTWGLRFYMTGFNKGLTFKIQLKAETTPLSVGPNSVLSDQKPPSQTGQGKQLPTPTTSLNMNVPNITAAPTTAAPARTRLGTGDRLLGLLQGAYSTLNATQPNRTQECWLCLLSLPPYYEGVAVQGPHSQLDTPPPARCLRETQHKLTLSEVSGQGLCLGNPPPSHRGLCNTIVTSGTGYSISPNGTYWACDTGLTHCASWSLLQGNESSFCVLIELFPRITYHEPEDIYAQFEMGPARTKREPVSLTLALMLGGLTMGGVAAGIGTGAKALVETQHIQQLQAAMNQDIQALEESISALEKSLTSLSEVVLQNRRGLDILFLQEGGLCAALKEECCFYADHTGLVRDSMAKLRERLKQRQRYFEEQQGWFEGWFRRSPWLTTLISTIMGPLLILVLILMFGPCILNRLIQFIKERISVVQTLVLTQQYQRLHQSETETPPLAPHLYAPQ
ncbi:uncharacterized protein LOC118590776 [Onychomys torridus]|uniref:uncharacterized protein LOC118590776 n=1 Tax=Onychomys torridus TaxID=38674 RepID=UPI00167F713E|nr:uncharacterized protein LOC118590776 [Onychomys torridus]